MCNRAASKLARVGMWNNFYKRTVRPPVLFGDKNRLALPFRLCYNCPGSTEGGACCSYANIGDHTEDHGQGRTGQNRAEQMEDRLRHILLVDDEPETLRLLRKVVQAEGYSVQEAADGVEALSIYRQRVPDLMLLDIIMPRLDGMAVLREVRSHNAITGIIMVSALTSEKLTLEAMQAGADDYVSKPFPLKELRTRISQVIEKVRLRQENAQLQRRLDEANARIKALFERYTSAPVAEQLMSQAEMPQLGGEIQEITVLFVDIRGFTPLAEVLDPRELVQILNTYLAIAADAMLKAGGTVDKFMGDSAMAMFNAPARQPDHVWRALQTAADIQKGQHVLRETAGNQGLSFGIGLHTGKALVGNIGTAQLMNFTAIGDCVNVAQRLQAMSHGGQVLLSADSYRHVFSAVEVRSLGEMRVRGRSEPITVYEFLGFKGEK